MLAGGWAAPYLHKDNLPTRKDLDIAVGAVQSARRKKPGMWTDEDGSFAKSPSDTASHG